MSRNFLYEIADTSKYVSNVLGGAVSKELKPCCVKQHNDGTPKHVAHVLGGVVSKKYRRLPRIEITDMI